MYDNIFRFHFTSNKKQLEGGMPCIYWWKACYLTAEYIIVLKVLVSTGEYITDARQYRLPVSIEVRYTYILKRDELGYRQTHLYWITEIIKGFIKKGRNALNYVYISQRSLEQLFPLNHQNMMTSWLSGNPIKDKIFLNSTTVH